MTIRIPPETIADKILALFGKKRKILPPYNVNEAYRKHGPYVDMMGRKESFWKVLLEKKQN